jgi:nitrite reductase (NADH) large subunit
MQQEFYYVIVGNGIAGLSAAEAIRQRDAYRPIAVISDENYLTYSRLVLSHHLGENILPETLYIHPQNWYDEKNISIILNTKALGIDTDGKVLKTNKGDINYTKLIIASGSYCFIPPVEGSDKKGVFALRGMDDLLEINHAIKQSNKAIVIGGGLLGLESAWGIKQKGLDVTVLEFFPRILPRQMDDEGSVILKGIIENLGIELYLGVEAAKISGNDKADGVVLKDGRSIPGDFVLFSSGVRPHVEFAKNAPISINKGIIVDEYMRTNAPDVYAAGDVAEHNGAMPAIWPIANAQGKIAGINAAGGHEKYKTIPPSNTLKVMGIDCFSVGDINNQDNRFKEIKHIGDTEYYKLFLDGTRLAGAIMIGDISKSMRLRSLIEQGKDMSDYFASDNAKEIIDRL